MSPLANDHTVSRPMPYKYKLGQDVPDGLAPFEVGIGAALPLARRKGERARKFKTFEVGIEADAA